MTVKTGQTEVMFTSGRFVVIDKMDNELKGFKNEADAAIFIKSKGEKGKGYRVEEKYFKTFDGKNKKYTYKSSESTFFPRMYSSEGRHVSGYKSWSGHTGDRIPTMGENLTYFATYQVDWMYWRYFMWNFSGRQSDEQGHGNARDGNWISGLNFIDKHHIGDQTNAPSIITDNPSPQQILHVAINFRTNWFHIYADKINPWLVASYAPILINRFCNYYLPESKTN